MKKREHKPPDEPGRFAYEGLERVIHEKARLGITASLAAHPEGLLFNDLKDLCTLTDGNLSRHLQVPRRRRRDLKVKNGRRCCRLGRRGSAVSGVPYWSRWWPGHDPTAVRGLRVLARLSQPRGVAR
jgi:hypothetical protein